MLRRSAGIFHAPRRPMSRPATSTRPSVATSSRNKSFRNVDLPEPEGPTRKTNSPLTFSNRIMGRPRLAARPSGLAAPPLEVRLDERVEVAVDHCLHVAGLEPCALVLYELVRREGVRADLVPECDV